MRSLHKTNFFFLICVLVSLSLAQCDQGGGDSGGGGSGGGTSSLPTPQNLTANAVACDQVDLSWDLVASASPSRPVTA